MSNRSRSTRAARASSSSRTSPRGPATVRWLFGEPGEPGASGGGGTVPGATRAAADEAAASTAAAAVEARALLERVALARAVRAPLAAAVRDHLARVPAAVLHRAAEELLVEAVAEAWARGWQPAELLRRARLECAGRHGARLAALAVATDHVGRRSTTLHSRWVAQVESLALPAVDGAPGWVGRWAAVEGLLGVRAAGAVGDVLAVLRGVPRLPCVLPPPGRPDDPAVDLAALLVDDTAPADPLLQRIRALLAKAESTTFEAEALACTAKAQELMTRHAIDAARVQGRRGSAERPVAVRIPVDPPYVRVKASLLGAVARGARCRVVVHTDVALATVLGHAGDVAAVEALFTSLLVQAEHALVEATARGDAGPDPTPATTRAFRRSFLTGFTGRVADRLAEADAVVVAAARAEHGDDFLPVLASREAAVEAFVAEQFGSVRPMRMRHQLDVAGWASGTAAGDRARLTRADLGHDTRRLGPGT